MASVRLRPRPRLRLIPTLEYMASVRVRLRLSLRPRLIPTFFMVAMADTLAMLVTMDMPDMEDMLTTVKQHTIKTLFCNRKWTEQPLLFSSSTFQCLNLHVLHSRR